MDSNYMYTNEELEELTKYLETKVTDSIANSTQQLRKTLRAIAANILSLECTNKQLLDAVAEKEIDELH